jgi:F420H(2)-dependent quinone reductase
MADSFADEIVTRVTWLVLGLHGKVYAATSGRIGHRLLGVPCLLLHTVGAKTGAARTHTLTYALDGDDHIVVASIGGGPKNPAWYHNLRAHPDTQIHVGPRLAEVTATPVVTGDPDYPRLWKLVNDKNHGRYDAYQRRTTRPIPLVRLTPRGRPV